MFPIVTVTPKLAEIPELGAAQTSQGSHQLDFSSSRAVRTCLSSNSYKFLNLIIPSWEVSRHSFIFKEKQKRKPDKFLKYHLFLTLISIEDGGGAGKGYGGWARTKSCWVLRT